MSWETKKLGEIASIIVGQSPKGENYNKNGDGLPFYQGKKNYGKKYLKEPNVWTNQITKKAIAGDILVSLRAPVGAINISTNDICIGRGLAAIRVSERVINNYLYYFLIMIQNEIKGSAGAIFNSLNKEQIKNILVPLPSLDEQRAIVGKLDVVFENIDKVVALTQAKKREVSSLKTSLLTNLLQQANGGHLEKRSAMRWETKNLGDVCKILDNLRKPITKRNRTVGNFPYYGASGIVDYVNDYIFDEKLILVGEDGAKWEAGEQTSFIVEGKYWVNNHAHVLKPLENKILDKWLVYYLNSIDLKPWITGLTVPKLNQKKLRSIPIPIPPLDEQRAIVGKLDAVFAEAEKLEAASIENEKNYSALKNALLRQMLSENNEVAA